MRTTLTIEPGLMRALKRLAADKGITFKEAVNRALRAGLARSAPQARKFRQRTMKMGATLVNLDKALALSAQLEDEEIARKVTLRK